MKTKLWTEGTVRYLRDIACLALLITPALFSSCEKEKNFDRSEYIAVYSAQDVEEELDEIHVGVRGGTEKIYVDSNIDFIATWEDADSSPWLTITDYSTIDPQSGLRVITMEVKRRTENSCYYTRRTGMLILSASDGSLNYNRILPVHQGAMARVSSDFSYLKYGKEDPRFSDDEVPIDQWTAAQKEYGFTSTVIEGEEFSHCYGKNGYVKLGDDKGHGADLISPFQNDLRVDSLLMVSFKAVAYTDFYTGAKDNNKITVEVLDGGVIADFSESGETSMDLEVPYYDFSNEEFPDSMWDGTDFLVFIKSTDLNPITVNTRVRISCGSFGQPATENSRIFIDNFYIRTLNGNGEDYFSENGGSGKDTILGIIPDDMEQE